MFECRRLLICGHGRRRGGAVIMIKRTSGLIYVHVIASLMVPAVAPALMADCALAAEMPKDFQGTWCTSSNTLKDDWDAYNAEGADCSHDFSSVEITASKVSIPVLSASCVVRRVTKFDVCPWGMIFRNRERARAQRPFQINPWSPGYHIVLQCTSGSKQSEAIGADWVIEKGSIRVGIPRDYRCPWDRKAPR
jgi:hypothetical protein